MSLETLDTTGKNERSLLDVDSGIIQKTGRVICLQFIRVWFIVDQDPITNLGKSNLHSIRVWFVVVPTEVSKIVL